MAKKNQRKRSSKSRPAKKRSWWRILLKTAIVLSLLGVLAGAAGVFALFHFYGRDLPTIDTARDYQPKQVSRLYASSGEVIATFVDQDAQYRTLLAFDEIPQVMRDAIIAAEDADFYSHPGLDYVGLTRAVITNIRRGQLRQGASTITQQVVKNLVLSPERTIRRKVQEALLAFQLEDRLSKDEILTIYLNEVFFGSRYYGVEEASRYYFGHGAAELSLPEAALLAGLVQSPNRYNPHYHPEEALARRAYVLRQMWEKGHIEEGAYREADDAPLGLDPDMGVGIYEGAFPWFVDAVRRDLLDRFPEETVFSGGLRVETTLDVALQNAAQEAIREGLRAFDGRHGFHTPFRTFDSPEEADTWRRDNAGDIDTLGLRPGREYRAIILEHAEEATIVGIGPFVARLDREPLTRVRPDDQPWDTLFPLHSAFTVTSPVAVGPESLSTDVPGDVVVQLLPSAEAALVSIDPTNRHVVALVGGYDFDSSAFNRAIQARRQVGSAFKPIVFGAALRTRSVTPGDVYFDQPVTFPLENGRTWQPRNYDGRFQGPMSIRRALASSRNVIAVRVLDRIGLDAATLFARDMGIDTPLTDNLTLALGSAELTPFQVASGFTTLAANGVRDVPVLVTNVSDARANVLYTTQPTPEQTIDPATAWLTTSLMTSVVREGTGGRARAVGHPVAGKTGTTNGARDAWFVGYTRHLVTAVWIGRDNNEELGRGEAGGASALPVWTDFMTQAHDGREVLEFERPRDGLVSVRIDEATGLLARDGHDGRNEWYLAGTEPTTYAPDTQTRAIDDILLDGGSGGAVAPPTPINDDGF